MNQIQKTSRISAVFLGSMLLLALQLFSGKANAVVIPITSFTCTQTPTSTPTCVGNGAYANGWFTPGGGYWQYVLNTNGYTTISMTFSHQKSSAAGPTAGQVYYNLGGSDIAVPGGSFTVSTSCQSKTIALPVACEGVSGLIIRVKMTGATANTATHRITGVNVFNGSSTSCSTTPASGGTVSASANPVCAGSPSTLTLSGSTGGAGITTKWQVSADGISFSDVVPAATGLSYNVPTTLTDTMYYRAVTTCSALPASLAYSNTLRLDVNTVVIAPITGYTNPLYVGTTQDLNNATPFGLWFSSNASSASVNDTGLLRGLFGGVSTISYQVTDLVNGCIGSQSITVNTVWPNTLALYAGSTGSNTNVIPVPGDHTSSLYNVGFGTLATQCGAGGFSGLTLDPAVDTAYDENGPHIGYRVYADAGNNLNMYRIHARARTSNTGATKAVIAYRYWHSGGFEEPWAPAANVIDLTPSNCGVMDNDWDFNTGSIPNPNPSVNGMDSLEVAVFPFAPVATGGTFQLGQLEVYGVISDDAPCTGTPIVAADSALPSVAYVCDSGYKFLNYNLGTGGIAGPGIEYQWQVYNKATSTWDPVPDAQGVVYQTDTFTAGMTSDTTLFRVEVLCSGTPVSYSEPSMVVVSPTPANAGTISGIPNPVGSVLGGRMYIDSTYTLTSSAGLGGTWSSNDTSVISINPTSGVATPHIPGDAVFTYRKAVAGCFASSKDTSASLYRFTQAIYIGKGGNSTGFNVSPNALPAGTANITTANWTTGATCSNGGVSGLVNADLSPSDATNGRVVMSVRANTSDITVREIRATVRKQPSGSYMAYLGYSPEGMNTWTLSTPEAVESDDCGYSHNELVFHFASPVTLGSGVGAGYDFAVFAYNGSTTPPAKTFQVNSISVIDTTGSGSVSKPTGVNDLNVANNIQLYPNPVENTLNINATEAVNVTIFSIDGKKLLEQKNVKSVDVSNLMSGMYLIQVSNQNNMLLKTEKFIKK